jgi:hypothetical protein
MGAILRLGKGRAATFRRRRAKVKESKRFRSAGDADSTRCQDSAIARDGHCFGSYRIAIVETVMSRQP